MSKTLVVELKSSWQPDGAYGKWEWAAPQIAESIQRLLVKSPNEIPNETNELTIKVFFVDHFSSPEAERLCNGM